MHICGLNERLVRIIIKNKCRCGQKRSHGPIRRSYLEYVNNRYKEQLFVFRKLQHTAAIAQIVKGQILNITSSLHHGVWSNKQSGDLKLTDDV